MLENVLDLPILFDEPCQLAGDVVRQKGRRVSVARVVEEEKVLRKGRGVSGKGAGGDGELVL